MKFHGFKSSNKLAQDVAIGSDPHDSLETDHGKEKAAGVVPNEYDLDIIGQEIPSPNVQEGIKKVEAVTLTWTKKELIFAYAW
jgi:hypothetical protein